MSFHWLIRFIIVDYGLRDTDRIKATEQMNAEIAGMGSAAASDPDP